MSHPALRLAAQLLACCALLVGGVTCGEPAPAAQPSTDSFAVSDTASGPDSTPLDVGAAQDGAGAAAPDLAALTDAAAAAPAADGGAVAPDVPGFDCPGACAGFAVCGEPVSPGLCTSLCATPATSAAAQACLKTLDDCGLWTACMVAAGEPKKLKLLEFDSGPPGTGWRDLAGDFTVPTTAGDWTYSEQFDGHGSCVCLFVGKGLFKTQTGADYLWKLWTDAGPKDLQELLKRSPATTHWFFAAYLDADGKDNAAAYVNDMRLRFDAAMEKMAPLEKAKWLQRLHFVTTRAPRQGDPPGPQTLGGWLGKLTGTRTPAAFAIDRTQHVRQVGLLSVVGSTKLFLQHLAFEARYYDYEWTRAAAFPEQGMKIVTLYDKKKVGDETFDFALPAKEELAGYDTLEVDVAQDCDAHDIKNCFEWDYHAHLRVVERPTDPADAATPATCQVEAKGDPPVAAATQACTCITPRQETVARLKTCVVLQGAVQAKPAEGDKPAQEAKPAVVGWSKCGCQEYPRIFRWITTYHREGRWIAATPLGRYHLGNGGTVRFQFKGSYPYTTTLKLRFRKTGAPVPTAIVPLFSGGGWGPGYNAKYQPTSFAVPASVKKVELHADVTGHGFGDLANCAEFCNHTHHFTIKPAGDPAGAKTWVRDNPWVGNFYGCAEQVDVGTVPNQFGTWTLGRGGWCPGLDVKPSVWDVTAQAKPGTKATVSYQGLFQGKEYVAQPGQGGGFGAYIDMDSWIALYE
ncbi:MAG: hypothetical protein EXR79_15420 [Myxococcales bacterium]|nr:hypothetical protein [Myxococcales bacterium]